MKPIMKSNVILRNFKVITRRRQPQQFECDHCSKPFTTYHALALHVRSHTKESDFSDVCGQPEISAESLKEHMNNQQCKLSFKCPECKKQCKSAQGVRIHAARVHNKKPKTKQIKKIPKEKNYMCLFCNKKYRSEGYLKSHMVKVHEDMPQTESYRCEQCDFTTLNKCFMKKHVLIHTGYHKVTCEVCGKKIVKSYLTEHMRIHTGEKPYICCYCGKTFGGKKYLIVHERIHTGEKPYQCQLCNKRFTQVSPLRVHILCHMKKNEAVKND